MRMIEITEHKVDKLSNHIEQGLRHIGKAMQCVDEWMEEGGMHHERGGMGYREYDGYGRYGYPHEKMRERYPYMNYRDDDDEMEEIHERRRRRDSRGRYM